MNGTILKTPSKLYIRFVIIHLVCS
uniref:Uncharacterized protein n=1 Tax=Moniliophthora roreri TaxID=221103 RepID=A0A0W0F6Z2_MONRR